MQGHSLNELAFVSQPGLAGSWVGFIFNVPVLAAQFWMGAYGEIATKGQTKSFFLAYLTAPIVLVMCGGYKY